MINKKLLKILAITLSVALAIQSSLLSASAALLITPGAKVAVSVINNTGYRNIETQIEDRVIQSLLLRGCGVVERAYLNRIMQEKQIRIVFDDDAGQAELGRLAGADYMMVIRVDAPKVEKKLFREGGKQYEKLASLTVSISVRVLSVADGSIADMAVLEGSRYGLSDKTYNDLPAETVEAVASKIRTYISPPPPRAPRGKSEIPTWGWVAIGVGAVVLLVVLAKSSKKSGETGKKCLEEVCKKEECSDYDAYGNCIEWKCVEKECVKYEEKVEKTTAAPVLHNATTLKPYLNQVNEINPRFQISENFEVRVKLFEWRY
jgi:hypothetical protein